MEEGGTSKPVPFTETLKRGGDSWESMGRLIRKCEEAEQLIGIHGVSVTAGPVKGPYSEADRQVVVKHFIVHDTPTRKDRLHRTIELPKPITEEFADTFNRVFGRTRGQK